MKTILLSLTIFFLFVGCAEKAKQKEFNKPASYWYNKMIKQITQHRLDDADDTFISLESEHRNSPLIPNAILIIANAHMEEEEYTMANYYYDEYLKKFGTEKNIDYIYYLKIKTNFLSFNSQFRDQSLITKTLVETDLFLDKYKDSPYVSLVKTIRSRLLMAKAKFDAEIAALYDRIDKPKAKEYYETKAKRSWKDSKSIKDVDVPWYRWIFE